MVGLLALAHEHACEAELAQMLDALLEAGVLPDLDALRRRFAPVADVVPTVIVSLPDLAAYDALCVA
jgi:hypothetical protein